MDNSGKTADLMFTSGTKYAFFIFRFVGFFQDTIWFFLPALHLTSASPAHQRYIMSGFYCKLQYY